MSPLSVVVNALLRKQRKGSMAVESCMVLFTAEKVCTVSENYMSRNPGHKHLKSLEPISKRGLAAHYDMLYVYNLHSCPVGDQQKVI